MDVLEQWRARGEHRTVAGRSLFVVDLRPARPDAEPVLILHGFPTCSFDWRLVVDELAVTRRVVLFDMLGYGLSEKPDQRYSLFEQADLAEALARDLGLTEVALVTHDMGDSVGGELLARALDGTGAFEIGRRVITNGSIYMDLVQLSAGQELMLALPDAKLPPDQAPGPELIKPALATTFATPPADDELDAHWRLIEHDEGNRLLPRLIRYVEERRVHEGRWTAAIEKHPSPLTIVWGDADPIAVFAMAERLASARADATFVRLEGVGHYPMIEVPERVGHELSRALAQP